MYFGIIIKILGIFRNLSAVFMVIAEMEAGKNSWGDVYVPMTSR